MGVKAGRALGLGFEYGFGLGFRLEQMWWWIGLGLVSGARVDLFEHWMTFIHDPQWCRRIELWWIRISLRG